MAPVISLASITATDMAMTAAALERGRLIAVPTDTVYGIACKPEPEALERLYAVKKREPRKPLALVFDDMDRLVHALTRLPAPVLNALEELLPGPATAVLPLPGSLNRGPAAMVAYGGGVGVRVLPLPAASLFQRLPSPLALTSANLSGGPDPCSVGEIPETVREACEFVLDGGSITGCRPSTVVDLRPLVEGAPARILREGKMAADRIADLIGPVVE